MSAADVSAGAASVGAVVPAWRPSTGPRERIVATACELFNRMGIRAVGVDAIMTEAGVARNTFYRYFPSKDDLVVAFLERTDAEWRSWFTAAVHASGGTAHERLLGVFAVLPAWFASPTFRGSPSLNAAAEVGDSHQQVVDLARAHNEQVHVFLAGLAAQDGWPDADGLARQLQLLLNGAVVAAQLEADVESRRSAAQHAGRVAQTLLSVGRTH